MSGLITTRTTRIARRRAISFATLLGLSIVCMAFSSSPVVTELQKAAAFAFRPLQASAAGVASGIGSVVESLREIDPLRGDNEDLRARHTQLQNQKARLQGPQAAEQQP